MKKKIQAGMKLRLALMCVPLNCLIVFLFSFFSRTHNFYNFFFFKPYLLKMLLFIIKCLI